MISVIKNKEFGFDFSKLSSSQKQVVEERFAYVKHIEQVELASIK